jgi:hypothetical protein
MQEFCIWRLTDQDPGRGDVMGVFLDSLVWLTSVRARMSDGMPLCKRIGADGAGWDGPRSVSVVIGVTC